MRQAVAPPGKRRSPRGMLAAALLLWCGIGGAPAIAAQNGGMVPADTGQAPPDAGPSPEAAFAERELANGPLRGTLAVPAGRAGAPAALILAGSGPVDRDGNLPGARNDSLKQLARELAARGIATLRIDKRGIAASASGIGSEAELRFETFVADALSWLQVLEQEAGAAGLPAPRLFLIGHSEGALVATLAARRRPVSGLVLLAGAGQPACALIARQLVEARVPEALRARAQDICATLERQEPVAEVPPELHALYRPGVQPYLMSWLPLDPAAELAKVEAPVLLVQGTTDLQVTLDDARRLAAARPGARRATLAGMNHVLKPAPAERGANLATYADPALPLAPALVPALADFIHAP